MTRNRVPVTGGDVGGSIMSSGESRAVSIHRCQPEPAVSGIEGSSKSRDVQQALHIRGSQIGR